MVVCAPGDSVDVTLRFETARAHLPGKYFATYRLSANGTQFGDNFFVRVEVKDNCPSANEAWDAFAQFLDQAEVQQALEDIIPSVLQVMAQKGKTTEEVIAKFLEKESIANHPFVATFYPYLPRVLEDVRGLDDVVRKEMINLIARVPKKVSDQRSLCLERRRGQRKIKGHRATCDGCGMCPIVGVRHKCDVCSDFDFCDQCRTTASHDATHTFSSFQTWRDFRSWKEAKKGEGRRCWRRGHKEEAQRAKQQAREEAQRAKHQAKEEAQRAKQQAKEEAQRAKQQAKEEARRNKENFPRMAFVSDVNLPDGSVIAPGAEVKKMWALKNSGDVAWPATTRIVFCRGDDVHAVPSVVGAVAPGESVDVAVEFIAPTAAGKYRSRFRLEGEKYRIGSPFWVLFEVSASETKASANETESSAQVPSAPERELVPEPVPEFDADALLQFAFPQQLLKLLQMGFNEDKNALDMLLLECGGEISQVIDRLSSQS
jgi:hypothetical protein